MSENPDRIVRVNRGGDAQENDESNEDELYFTVDQDLQETHPEDDNNLADNTIADENLRSSFDPEELGILGIDATDYGDMEHIERDDEGEFADTEHIERDDEGEFADTEHIERDDEGEFADTEHIENDNESEIADTAPDENVGEMLRPFQDPMELSLHNVDVVEFADTEHIESDDGSVIADTAYIESDDVVISLTGSSYASSESDNNMQTNSHLALDENYTDFNLDRNLAGMHNYLNKEMEQLAGRTILDANDVIELYLFWWPNVILVPGQRLPIQVPHGPADIFKHAKETNKIIGFVASPIDRSNLDGCIGTTAELLSIKSEESGVTVMVIGRQRFRTLKVVRRNDNNLRGSIQVLPEHSECLESLRYPLQNAIPFSWRIHGSTSERYRLDCAPLHYEALPNNVSRQNSGNVDQTGELDENINSNNNGSFISRICGRYRNYSRSNTSNGSRTSPTSPLESPKDTAQSQIPLALLRADPLALVRSNQSTWVTREQFAEMNTITTPAMDSKGQPFSFQCSSTSNYPSRIPARRDVHAATAHTMGVFPSWVYEMYDIERLIAQVVKELKQWNSTWKLDHWTAEISVQFSYWLLQNLPVPDVQKIELLELDHVVPRLQGCLRLLQKCSNFLCATCNGLVTEKERIICLAAEGSLQTFVNPHGHLHEMLTVSMAHNIQLIGRATEEYSWFPGYSWTIIQCWTCSSHLGWKFIACRPNLRPTVFYGVCRSSVVPSFIGNSQNYVSRPHAAITNARNRRNWFFTNLFQ